MIGRSIWHTRGTPPYAQGVAKHADALFSVNRALWERVTPDLRGVAYTLTDESLTVRFMYADEPSDATRELVSEAETESMADWLPPFQVSFHVEHLPVPEQLTIGTEERWVYLRYEDPANDPGRPRPLDP